MMKISCKNCINYINKNLTQEGIQNENVPIYICQHRTVKENMQNKDIGTNCPYHQTIAQAAYEKTLACFKKYCDLKPEYYPIVTLWTMGTYIHSQFYTYPYLLFNAFKRSGKSRILHLISTLAYKGSMIGSLNEAVLFRSEPGTTFCIEEFEAFRPIVLANISGVNDVLADRCVSLVLERSFNYGIVNMIEAFEYDDMVLDARSLNVDFSSALLNNAQFSVEQVEQVEQKGGAGYPFSVDKVEQVDKKRWVGVMGVYLASLWNDYILNYTPTISTTSTTYITSTISTKDNNKTSILLENNNQKIDNEKCKLKNIPEEIREIFEKMRQSKIIGRNFELSFPLLIIASKISPEIFNQTLQILEDIMAEKEIDDVFENLEQLLLQFLNSKNEEWKDFTSLKDITQTFKSYIEREDDKYITPRRVSGMLKKLAVIKKKRLVNGSTEFLINMSKVQTKIANMPVIRLQEAPKEETLQDSYRENKEDILLKSLSELQQFPAFREGVPADAIAHDLIWNETEVDTIISKLAGKGIIYEVRAGLWRLL